MMSQCCYVTSQSKAYCAIFYFYLMYIVSIENIKNFFCKAQNYMVGYLEGFVAGPDLEKQITSIKSNINPTGEPVWTTDVTMLMLFPI